MFKGYFHNEELSNVSTLPVTNVNVLFMSSYCMF